MIFRLLRCRISHITRGSAIQGQFSYSHAGLPFVFFHQKVKVMMSEAQRKLEASWSKYHCVAGTSPLPGVAILQIISCSAPMSVSLPCTSVYILFLLIYLDIYLPSFSTDAPFWTILPTHYCLFTLLLKFFTVLHSEQWRDQFSWLRVATGIKLLEAVGFPSSNRLVLPMILFFPSSELIEAAGMGWSKVGTEIKQMERWHFTVKVLNGIMRLKNQFWEGLPNLPGPVLTISFE